MIFNLAQARAISDALLTREPIQGLEATELEPEEGMRQWRLAQVLQDDFADTVPAWELV